MRRSPDAAVDGQRAGKGRATCRWPVSLLLCLGVVANAHIFLTLQSLDDAIAGIVEAQSALDGASVGSSSEEPTFRLGEAATELTALMNEEVRAHGRQQDALLSAAVSRAAAAGVEIAWSDDHQRYFYDGAAFERYLAISPDGRHSASSRFRLIELDFYLGDAETVAALARRAAAKEDFLARFPGYREAARVAVFLGVDYRDIWRLCRAQGDAECASAYLRRAVEQLRSVSRTYVDSDDGEIAGRLLERLKNEAAAPAQ